MPKVDLEDLVTNSEEQEDIITNGNGKSTSKPGSGNIYMKRPTREMLFDEYKDPETGHVDSRFNREYVMEKFRKDFIQTLEFEDEKEFKLFCNDCWKWALEEDKRKRQKIVERAAQTFDGDIEALQAMKRKVEQMLNELAKGSAV